MVAGLSAAAAVAGVLLPDDKGAWREVLLGEAGSSPAVTRMEKVWL